MEGSTYSIIMAFVIFTLILFMTISAGVYFNENKTMKYSTKVLGVISVIVLAASLMVGVGFSVNVGKEFV